MRVVLTGCSLVLETVPGGHWQDLAGTLRAKGSAVLCESAEAAEELGICAPRDRRILSVADVLGIAAADIARRDASLELKEDDGRTGAIVVSTGKDTVPRELGTYRRRFMNERGRLDGRRMREAIDSGQAQIDPFDLLHGLDNSVIWWLCRNFQIGGLNLQIIQSHDPDLAAMREAWELVAEGTCDRVVVGGYQTREQSRVDLVSKDPTRLPDVEGLAGGSVFLILESLESARARGARIYGEMQLATGADSVAAPRSPARVAPALSGLFAVFACAQGFGASTCHLRAAETSVWKVEPMAFERTSP